MPHRRGLSGCLKSHIADADPRIYPLIAEDYRTEVIALRFCAQASEVEAASIGRDLP